MDAATYIAALRKISTAASDFANALSLLLPTTPVPMPAMVTRDPFAPRRRWRPRGDTRERLEQVIRALEAHPHGVRLFALCRHMTGQDPDGKVSQKVANATYHLLKRLVADGTATVEGGVYRLITKDAA